MRILFPSAILASLWLTTLNCHSANKVPQAPTDRPNIIVMIADDLGSGDVSCLFRDVVKTPNMDRLAAMGIRFRSGYVTAPLCGPSRAGFFTGRYQERFGFVSNLGGIPANMPLLPGVLHDAGYRTALIGKWHSQGPMPFERGCFDYSLCSPVSSAVIDYHHPKLALNGKVQQFDEYSTDLFADKAVQFIDENRGKPFNLTVTFNAPHILKVAEPAPKIREEYDAAVAAGKTLDVPKVRTARPGDAEKYAAQFPGDTARADTVATIAAFDQAIGRILDKLKETGLDKKTVIFLFADNGGHPENRSENLPLRDYKWSVYEGGIRVPFIAAYPGVFPAGVEYSNPVCSFDIFPTCCALAGGKPPEGLDGVDLTPYLTGAKTSAPHDCLFFAQQGLGGVRQDHWKLVLPMHAHAQAQLFDLSSDVEEKHDLADSQPELVKELSAKWEAWNAQMPPPSNPDKVKRGGRRGGKAAPEQKNSNDDGPGKKLCGVGSLFIASRQGQSHCEEMTRETRQIHDGQERGRAGERLRLLNVDL